MNISMPEMLTGYNLKSELEQRPYYDDSIRTKSVAERISSLSDIYSLYIPSQMSVEIYNKLYLALMHSIQKKNTKQAIRQQNENRKAILGREHNGIIGGSDSFTIIGVSGIGKSSAIERAIRIISENEVIYTPETIVIPFVTVQCPFDSSVKGLLLEILRQVDDAIGSHYYTISKLTGSISSIVKNGKEILAEPVRLTAWRAPTDNDRKIKYNWGMYEDNLSAINLNCLFNKVYSCEIDGNEIRVKGNLAGVSRIPFLYHTIRYKFFENGVQVIVDGEINEKINCPFLPRLGFEFVLNKENDTFTYFGMGDSENYCDMCRHTKIGRYTSCAEKEYVNYIMPQEHGNHTRAKMLSMDCGVEFIGDSEFEFNVSEYTAEALTQAMHIDELVKNDKTNVRIDYKVSGIGSNSCGPQLLEKYWLGRGKFNFSFYIK